MQVSEYRTARDFRELLLFFSGMSILQKPYFLRDWSRHKILPRYSVRAVTYLLLSMYSLQ